MFQKSFTIQNTFRNELDLVKTFSTHNPSLIFIAQVKNDVRYCVGDHIINSTYGKKIKSISTDKGSIILGLKDNIIKKDSPFLASVYLLKGKKYQSFTSGLNKSGRLWKANCPFHEEKTPSFIVDEAKKRWHCFGACNIGGDVIEIL